MTLPDVELMISFNGALPVEAIAARDAVSAWVNASNIHVWHGVAEGGEATSGYSARRRLSELAIVHHVNCLAPDVAISASPMEGQLDVAVPLPPREHSQVPVAGIFYDAIPFRYPHHYIRDDSTSRYYHRRFRGYSQFDLNLCISDFCRRESLELTGNANSVDIGAGISTAMRQALRKKDGPLDLISGQYALYVGALDWRKNPQIVADAFALLPAPLKRSTSLVLAGPDDSHRRDEFVAAWTAAGLPRENLRLIDHPSDDTLGQLYRSASVVIQPAVMEGFGLTALEAMEAGTAVLASDIPALREIVKRDDLLFDPSSPGELASKLGALLSNASIAKENRAYGKERAKSFGWDRSARLAHGALTRLVGGIEVLRPANVIESRHRILASLPHLRVGHGLKAETLSRAEPFPESANRLIVDATHTSQNDLRTGIQRVVKHLSSHILSLRTDGSAVIGYCDADGDWYDLGVASEGAIPRVEKTDAHRIRPTFGDTLLMLDSSWDIQSRGFNSLHKARLRGAQVVSCIYDLVPLRYPAFCGGTIPEVYSRWLQQALGYSTGFVCISRSVADEFLRLLETIRFPRRVNVGYWHLGADGVAKLPDPSSRTAGPTRSFLMVGTLEPRKGHRIALDAFDKLWSQGRDAELVIVGKQGWGADSLAKRILEHREYGKRLHWHSDISDRQLATFYENADALIAASFAEGFGLPIVEAAQAKLPVLASDISVFREVSANVEGVYFFEVGSADDLARVVVRLLLDGPPALRAVTTQTTSWRQSAMELERLLRTNDWYKVYDPPDASALVPITDIGKVTMQSGVADPLASYELALVDGPDTRDGHRHCVVRLHNRSTQMWSSTGGAAAATYIELRSRVAYPNGKTGAVGARSALPFVLAPKDSIYLSVELPNAVRAGDGAQIEIDVVEKGHLWWGSPLWLQLS